MAKTRTRVGGNRKTKGKGKLPPPIVETSRTADTCADNCPFKRLGIDHKPSEGGTACYAVQKPGGGNSYFDNAEKSGTEDTALSMRQVEVNAPPNAVVRHLVSGDIGFEGDTYIEEANKLHANRPDLQGYGYTHNWENIDPESIQGWKVNASVETPGQAEDAISKGWDVAIVSPKGDQLAGTRIAGRRVVTCPAELDLPEDKKVGCAECRLCRSSGPNRPIVEFPAHGASSIVGKIVSSLREQEQVTASSSPDGDSTDNDAAAAAARNSSFINGFNDR